MDAARYRCRMNVVESALERVWISVYNHKMFRIGIAGTFSLDRNLDVFDQKNWKFYFFKMWNFASMRPVWGWIYADTRVLWIWLIVRLKG